jgi:hypothetical protein
MTVAVSRNNHWNFIDFIVPVTLPATFSGFAVREISLALAGLSKEGFIHFDNAGKGIRVGVGTGV